MADLGREDAHEQAPDQVAADQQAADQHAADLPGRRARLQEVATTIAHAASPVVDAVEQLTGGARRAIGERSGARVRHVRRMGRQPLLNLWDAHPEAHRAALRELGLRAVSVDEIVGTAVEGPTQRGADFLPLRQRRGQDWRGRWQRILRGVDELATLPPVDLLKFGPGYWVVDGHNRVAAALYTGQVAVDANVVELRLPGQPSEGAVGNLAPFLEGSRDVREAGSGRLARTVVRPESLMPEHPRHEHPLEEREAPPAQVPEEE